MFEPMPTRFKRMKSVRCSLDDIYGDPIGIRGRSKCEMPAAAVVSVVGGGMALGGAFGALTAFQTIAAIGAVVGGIGTLTGDSTLTKIGSVMGIAGGIGHLGASQGWWPQLGGAAEATAAIGEGGNIANMTNAETAGLGTEGAAQAVSGGESAVSDAIASSVDPNVAAISDTGGNISEAITGQSNVSSAISGQNDFAKAMADRLGETAGNGLMDAGLPADVNGIPTTAGGEYAFDDMIGTKVELGLWDRFTSAADNVSTWMDKHKVASEAILKGVGGLADTYGTKGKLTDAQRRLYETRTEAEKAAMANANYAGPDIRNQFALKPGTTPYVGTGIMFAGKK